MTSDARASGCDDCLLESVYLPASASGTEIRLTNRFKKGATYRVVVSGTVTRTMRAIPGVPETTEVLSAFHRVSCTRGGAPCGEATPMASDHLNIFDRGNAPYPTGLQYHVIGGPGTPSHPANSRYTLRLNAFQSRFVSLIINCCFLDNPNYTHSGGFKVEIYGPRPEVRQVKWSVTQRGGPAEPDPLDPYLLGNTTFGLGKVFFSDSPGKGRTKGDAAGVVRHDDELFLGGETFAQWGVDVAIYGATYAKKGAIRTLALRGKVTYANSHKVEKGSLVEIGLIDDPDGEDLMTWYVGCTDPKRTQCGDSHRYAHGSGKTKLDIKISAVSKVR